MGIHFQNSPHTLQVVTDDQWSHAYTRRAAGYPRPYCLHGKQWPTCGRVDDAYGDTHLQCSWWVLCDFIIASFSPAPSEYE